MLICRSSSGSDLRAMLAKRGISLDGDVTLQLTLKAVFDGQSTKFTEPAGQTFARLTRFTRNRADFGNLRSARLTVGGTTVRLSPAGDSHLDAEITTVPAKTGRVAPSIGTGVVVTAAPRGRRRSVHDGTPIHARGCHR